MDTTRRLLERLPVSALDWKPHARSKTLGELATHIVENARWGARLRDDSFTVGSIKPPDLRTVPDYLARFSENIAASRSSIEAMTDEELARDFTVLRNGAPFFTLSKRAMLRRVLLNHIIHHRGQLTVYLRLHDVPLPSIYGPTADEP